MALRTAWEKLNDDLKLAYSSQPKGIYAQTHYKEGQIKLVPLSSALGSVAAGDRKPPGAVLVGFEYETAKAKMCVYAASMGLPSEDSKKDDFIVPFFHVKRSDVPDNCNMKWITYPVKVTYGPHEISVPLIAMSNSKYIKAGEELVIHSQVPTNTAGVLANAVASAPRKAPAAKDHSAPPAKMRRRE